MKNQLFGLIILLASLNSYCQIQESDSSICLEIKGKILGIDSKSEDSYTCELVYFNTVEKKENIGAKKSFTYKLKINSIYTIRISKDGYITKLISIYTRLPKIHDELYKLDFETDLIPVHKSKKLDSDVIDFPVTIIYYDEKANWFYFNEEYTSNIKRQLHNVKVVRNKI